MLEWAVHGRQQLNQFDVQRPSDVGRDSQFRVYGLILGHLTATVCLSLASETPWGCRK